MNRQRDREGGTVLLLGAAQVASALQGAELLQPLADALTAYSSGRAQSSPRVAAQAPRGLLGAMPAYLPGRALGAKLITVFPANLESGKPSHQGLIALFDEADGTLLCVMDARQITALRTAAVSALSVRELARPGSRVLTVLGSGEQARAHLRLIPAVREFAQVRLASRNPAHAQALVQEFPGCRVGQSFEAAVRGADVVVCCTDAPEPVVRLSWLSQGAHLVSVGSGPEVDESTLREARLFVEWRGAVTSPAPSGAAELQGLNPDAVTELGEVISGSQPGRLSNTEITVFKSTGLGIEDAVVGATVYSAAQTVGLGVKVSW